MRYSPAHCPLQQASYSDVHFYVAMGCDRKFALNNYHQRHSTAKGSDYGEKGPGRSLCVIKWLLMFIFCLSVSISSDMPKEIPSGYMYLLQA